MNTLEKRHRFITEQIELNGSVDVIELARSLNVSDMTIRRDLTDLEKAGNIRRIHGGAISVRGRSFEPPLALRSAQNLSIKQMLGKYASKMIGEGDSIALDVGSTIYELSVNLNLISNITIITPSIPIAKLFFDRSDVRLILPGGIVRPGETSMIGELARRNLDVLYVDRLFLGVGAVDAHAGLTEFNMDDAAVKQAMIKNAKEIIVVADASKLQKIAFAFVASFDVLHHFITNEEPPKELTASLNDSGVTIHVVSEKDVRVF